MAIIAAAPSTGVRTLHGAAGRGAEGATSRSVDRAPSSATYKPSIYAWAGVGIASWLGGTFGALAGSQMAEGASIVSRAGRGGVIGITAALAGAGLAIGAYFFAKEYHSLQTQ